MKPTILQPAAVASRSVRRQKGQAAHADRSNIRRERRASHEGHVLGRYTDPSDRPRELVLRPGSGGSALVLDRDVVTHGDRRLVAHLGADEPAENAALVCRSYLRDAPLGRCRCRLVTAEDFRTAPFADDDLAEPDPMLAAGDSGLLDRHGRSYRLELLDTGMSIPELRWRAHPAARTDGEPCAVSVRHAISCLEAYEPVRTLTRRALALSVADSRVSTAVLRGELARMQESPIVLNRGLRESVLDAVTRQGLSMSEIAIRCGRVKLDRNGNESGETSWLARRLGLLPEGGRDAPTPWVHSDVLALIARCGLGISPREVELG